jgi:amino acid transporter/mannitol/fructose-specific phosphotransferase system IIA component (Ntr-type)
MRSKSRDLKRQLGFLAIFSIAAGAMISSGLFVLPGLAYAEAGPAVILSYALAVILMIPAMLSKAELATAMPKSGGSYFFIERALGPLLGTVAGLANWLSIALKSAFALVGIGVLATLIFPNLGIPEMKAAALAACVFFAILNIVSIKETGRLQVALILGLLAIIAVYCFEGLQAVNLSRLQSPGHSFVRHGWQSVFAVAGMVFISFGGLTKVVSVSGEVRNPARNIPLGMFLAFGIISVLYVLAVFVTVGVVDGDELADSLAPLSLGAEAAMGRWGVIVLGIGALFAFATTANAGILAASRTPMAMSRDGLVPAFLSRTGRRFGSPHRAIIITAVFIMAVIAFLTVEDLVKTASTMMLLLFTLQNLSVIIMRRSGLRNYRPTFRAPLTPWLQIVTIAVYAFLIFEMGTIPLLLTGLFVIVAIVWYLAYVNPRVDRESAFVYLVKGIISKDIAGRGLEEELKQITLERDEVTLDRFDRLVNQAIVLDIEKCLSARELFREVSRALSPRVKIEEARLFDLFLKRELDSSTVVRPGLAIPHVIVDGEHIFELLLVRCKKGVVFSELHRPVTTAFVLVGSRDERNYHLRALMAIAHIVEKPDFESRWEAARNAEELRDVVLLSSRRREK